VESVGEVGGIIIDFHPDKQRRRQGSANGVNARFNIKDEAESSSNISHPMMRS